MRCTCLTWLFYSIGHGHSCCPLSIIVSTFLECTEWVINSFFKLNLFYITHVDRGWLARGNSSGTMLNHWSSFTSCVSIWSLMTTQSETKGERSLYFNLSLFLYFISWAMLPCLSWTPLLVTDKSQWYQCSWVTVYIPFWFFTRGFKRLRLWSKILTWVIKKKVGEITVVIIHILYTNGSFYISPKLFVYVLLVTFLSTSS